MNDEQLNDAFNFILMCSQCHETDRLAVAVMLLLEARAVEVEGVVGQLLVGCLRPRCLQNWESIHFLGVYRGGICRSCFASHARQEFAFKA